MLILLCGSTSNINSDVPKPLNLINGIPMINYVLDSLCQKSVQDFELYIFYNKELDNYGFTTYLNNNFKNIKFKFIKTHNTKGPIETVYEGLKICQKLINFDLNEQLVFIDNDNIYTDFSIESGTFISYTKNITQMNHYSFLEISNNYIKKISERVPISDNICIGSYGFENAHLCLKYCKKVLDLSQNPSRIVDISQNPSRIVDISQNPSRIVDISQNPPRIVDISQNPPRIVDISQNPPRIVDISQNPPRIVDISQNPPRIVDISQKSKDSDMYLSKVFSEMINDSVSIKPHYLKDAFSIGTPTDIIMNITRVPHKNLRIVFDLDNTIVTGPVIYKDYSTVEPISQTIDLIKKLKAKGHTIIIHTARNMVTTGHNQGLAIKNIGLVTLESLNKFGIPFDEIHFGKPYGDLYIDDKAFNCYDPQFIRKMGFYDIDNNFKTNKFNKVIRLDNNSILKKGPDLRGEIFYYNKISEYVNNKDLSELFPKIISSDSEKSIIIEFINGTQVSKLYMEGLLNKDLFTKLLESVKMLHQSSISDISDISDNDIRSHYIQKFIDRSKNIENYPFSDRDVVYEKIMINIQQFLEKKYPINNIIHGDLWFSNMILINNNFKFYDMRGRIHDKFTIKGHTFYDFAKIYQSIVGLDSIIEHGIHINQLNRKDTEDIFWSFLLKNKMIKNDDIPIIIKLTGYLLYNTFNFYDEEFPLFKKNMIWSLVIDLINYSEFLT